LPVAINGGLTSLADALPHLDGLDGIMIGRAAYQRPGLLRDVDRLAYGDDGPPITDDAMIDAMHAYAVREIGKGVPLHHVTRPMIGLFHGAPGARVWRRMLTVDAQRGGDGPDLILRAYEDLSGAARRDAA
jgi:tRNA-dihydrouridine synthase A